MEKGRQKAKAQRIHKRLAQLKSGKKEEESGSESEDAIQESPHDFVQRRMREKAKEQQSANTSKEDQ